LLLFSHTFPQTTKPKSSLAWEILLSGTLQFFDSSLTERKKFLAHCTFAQDLIGIVWT
jgi:hypothetical protein